MNLYKHLTEALRDPKYWLPAPPPAPPIPVWLSNLIWDTIVPEQATRGEDHNREVKK